MNRCGELREQLEDAALGVAATIELEGHLAECPACAAELERLRALVQRLDETIQTAVQMEPPPGLLAGVSARLSPAVRASAWSQVRLRIGVWTAAVTCALILALGIRALEPPAASRSAVSALAAWRSPTLPLLEPRSSLMKSRPSPQRSPGGPRGS